MYYRRTDCESIVTTIEAITIMECLPRSEEKYHFENSSKSYLHTPEAAEKKRQRKIIRRAKLFRRDIDETK